jgi:hypothetical protein
MKPKMRFLGKLLPIKKLFKPQIKSLNRVQDPELYFAAGLIILWLLVFILTHLKPFTLHK